MKRKKSPILTDIENSVKNGVYEQIRLKPPTKRKPHVVALIGLIGSGKSTVAKALALVADGVVISADLIRTELRRAGGDFKNVRTIVNDSAILVAKQGYLVIIDDDFIDSAKRTDFRREAQANHIPLSFLCVYADIDTMIGRIIEAIDHGDIEDFFAEADTTWTTSLNDQYVGGTVKIREMLRRLPLHYTWKAKDGGKWAIKNPPCPVIGDIDTSNEKTLARQIAKVVRKLKP
jgi:predicted kinase